MNENEKKHYLEKYKKAKEDGVPFFPDILFKDAVIALLVFLILVGFAYFIGAPLENRANPADTSYTPRPEWYFLFLFQLLKYFPGNLEVLGVIVIPGLVIGLLFLLPLLDKHPRRHLFNRPWVTGITSAVVLGIVGLTVLSYLETPPPAEEIAGDPIAALYTKNCAACHGPGITVPEGIDLHNIIAQGTHQGMPAWSGDLDTNEIDALAGFITSPGGNDLYNQYCSECHQISDLVASNQIDLRDSLEQGQDYLNHTGVEIPMWKESLSPSKISELLNFLVAPDGQRLFTINCASCHGKTVAYAGGKSDLREIISQGGLHLEMPSWQSELTPGELDLLAGYVMDPSETGSAVELYDKNCSTCHGSRIPISADFDQAREAIARGGAHEIMPVWGEVLTESQLNALTLYTWESTQGTSLEIGQNLFAENCALCHGTFGEGGQNPARLNDIIAPISSSEYLTTRDNITLYNIIAQGQPNFGMSPFGSDQGGPLTEDQINSIISYMRNWELNPPVELPPEVSEIQDIDLTGQEVFNT
ncbi:MAG: c-type cytochrome, partial [Chloroflexi bacterium]|nr:c-type cytochrome [Chloroflexota bacterium]